MKRILSIIVSICAFCAAMAQTSHPMVTLSHNGELSFFTNVGAFKSAMDAAEDGDIIYLSQGDFIVDGGSYEINKLVSIVGNGYDSYILGNISFDTSREFTMDTPLFDGVRFGRLYIHAGKCDFEIRRCWIRTLVEGAAGRDIVYDKCYIENSNFSNKQSYTNLFVKNSKLGNLDGSAYNINLAQNCNMVLTSNSVPLVSLNCIITGKNGEAHISSGTINNSLLTFTPDSSSSVFTDGCHFYTENDGEGLLDDKLDCTIDLEAAGYFGKDGTIVGVYGGEDNDRFSENPSVPTVDAAKSSVEYDADNNTLKVSITVKAD